MTEKTTFEAPNLSVEDLSRALYDTSMRLQQANDKLRAQEKERLEFYANISHDLRAPITAINNALEYLDGNDSISKEELQKTISLLKNRTDYMKSLVNDIFLLSSLESSNDRFHPEEVDFCFFLEDYFYFVEADSKYSNCSLSLKISDALSEAAPIVSLDPHLMQRVLDNLLSNSVKYCEKSPKIEISADFVSDEKKEIYIKVKDNGIGIPEEAIPHIFDRSYQVESARTPGVNSSSGFGLAIVKTIVERHKGTVSCYSRINEGTLFYFEMPISL